MEDQGLQPSYIFLKGLSQAMRTRSTVSRLDKAGHILRNAHDAYRNSTDYESLGIRASTAALNTIISGYADLGLFEKAYSLYTSFADLNCDPDENTFIFMLDALYMNLSTALPSGYTYGNQNRDWVNSQEETADILVQEASYRGFQTGLMLEKYASILCVVGNVDKARNIIVDMVLDAEQNGQIPDITLDTFSCVSLAYASSGDTERADEIKNLCLVSGFENLPPYVEQRICRLRSKTPQNV
jgi:pentatricopeptide repeat domain (PPR motif)